MRLLVAYGLMFALCVAGLALFFWFRHNTPDQKYRRQIIRDRERYEATDLRKTLLEADKPAEPDQSTLD